MFEKGTRLKLRFETKRGNVSIEDLWDLPLTSRSGVSLDDIAKVISREIKTNEEESFVIKKSTSRKNDVLELKLSIVKHIISVLLDEAEKAELKEERKQKKQQILEIIESKRNQELAGKGIDELTSMLNELD